MKRAGASIAAVTLAAQTLISAAPAAYGAIPTHTTLDAPFHDRGAVYLTAGAQHWSRSRHHWVASRGQYVKFQVRRDGGWHYLGAVNVQLSNNPAWAVGTLIIRCNHRQTYRAVTPPVKVGVVYRAGSSSSARTG